MPRVVSLCHPVRDGSFDAASHDLFQRTIERFGLPECLAIKRRVTDAIKSGELPSSPAIVQDRHGRTNVRIALRQLKAAGMASPILQAWIVKFDSAAIDDGEDEAALQHAE
jgi:hypothetical protein